MGTKSQWLFKGQVIYTRYFDNVSLEDVAKTSLDGLCLLNEAAQIGQVNLILDSSAVLDYPRNLSALRQAMSPAFFARIDWLILISEDFFHRHIAQIFAQLFHMRFHTSSNLREAYRFLQQQMAVPPPQAWPDDSAETMPHR